MEINVKKEIGKRIRTVKDLNDFYAYEERFGGEDYSYDFGEETERIEGLMDSLNYEQGIYDSENVERILGL